MEVLFEDQLYFEGMGFLGTPCMCLHGACVDVSGLRRGELQPQRLCPVSQTDDAHTDTTTAEPGGLRWLRFGGCRSAGVVLTQRAAARGVECLAYVSAAAGAHEFHQHP